MSKLYLKYLEKKKENSDVYYLFKVGMFYIFIDEDALNISKIMPLKLTKLNDEVVKCGFPKGSFDKYMDIFKNLNIDVCVLDLGDGDNINKVIKKIKDLDLDNITPIKALNILKEMKGMVNG